MDEHISVSPLLDQMTVGACISSQNGISCYEITHESGQEFILKCISIPESPEKVSALILSGAYTDATAANEYFRRVADDYVAQVEACKQLADCPNFLRFLNAQVVAKPSGVGFDVYLLSEKSRSLRAYLADNAMSHLRAVNLGLDICEALDALRSAGFVFENLKPENIFVSDDGVFRLGDLGLAAIEDLRFSSLPEQYINCYTAPELHDIMSSVNTTVDIYALGLLLYRIYNGNHGAFEDEKTSAKAADNRRLAGEALPAPLYADYEMAEILLKACAFRPGERYQTPDELRSVLTEYAKRNELSDELIVPPIISDPEPLLEPEQELQPEPVAFTDVSNLDEEFKQHFAPDTAGLNAVIAAVRVEQAQEAEVPVEEVPVAEAPTAEAPTAEAPVAEASKAEAPALEILSDEKPTQEAPAKKNGDGFVLRSADDVDELLAATDAVLTAKPFVLPEAIRVTEQSLMQTKQPAEAAPEATEDEAPADEKPADEAPVENTPEQPPEQLPEQPPVEESKAEEFTAVYTDDGREDSDAESGKKKQKKQKKHSAVGWIIAAVIVVLLAAAAYGYYFTDFGRGLYHYFIKIDTFRVTQTTATSLTVELTSRIENPPVSLVCKDTYGNPITAELTANTVTFDDLTPNTQYIVSLSSVGTHMLLGETTCSAVTAPATEVLSFTAADGTEEGAVQLNLVVKEGNTEPESWLVTYSCEGGQEGASTFSGHSAQVLGLEVGKQYTFTLTDTADQYLIGETTTAYTPVKAVTVDKFEVVSFVDETLTLRWNCTSDLPENWTVTCTDDDGTQLETTVTDCSATFEGVTAGKNYLVKLTAVGLFQPTNYSIPADAISITAMTAENNADGSVTVSWETDRTPEGGWLLQCALGEEEHLLDTVTATENSVKLWPIPDAAYTLSLKAADDKLVIGQSTIELQTVAATAFSQYRIKASDLTLATYLVPDKDDWGYNDLSGKTDAFKTSDGIAFVLAVAKKPVANDATPRVLCVLRDENGKLVDYSKQSIKWNDLWVNQRYIAALPRTPETAGSYTLELYIGTGLAASTKLTVE